MRKIIIAVIAAMALLGTATPAQAVEFPPTWQCKDAGGGVYNCTASFTIKMPTTAKYLWASKTCKARVAARANALGAVPQLADIVVNSGARQETARRWRCGAFWQMTIPPTP